ncbi:Uncharacterised protein [Bordetella pertussis]|nr:Uncharacterised protein [Bordetella pertussis]CFM36624.1 Uncharacterised protein [Bordetella pertussis]CFM79760.1 Uncharacterised protein [Bordetella pertussis]CFM99646.1 Uncharacterised protein [Bordetella pertussis]CFN80087.1 Uncharacterised protein [Bordetella pertussis]
MAGVQEQVAILGGADDGRAVRRHRPQAGPELGLLDRAAAGEQIVDHQLQGLAARLLQAQIEARQLGHAADADALVEARDRDLVGFIQDGGNRRGGLVSHGNGERIALDGVDRQIQAQRTQKAMRIATERRDVAVGRQLLAAHAHANHLPAAHVQPLDLLVEAELHAQRLGLLGQLQGEAPAIAGFVVGQAQAAGQLVQRARQRRLGGGQAVAVEQFVRHAALFEHGDVAPRGFHLRGGAEQLQRALGALLVLDAGIGAQGAQAVAAVFGQAQHAFLVDAVAAGRAIGQHRRQPAPLVETAVGADGQRRMLLEHPLQRLERDAGRRPRRGVARRHLAGIAVAGFVGRPGAALQHRDLRALARQIIGGRRADDAAAQDDDVHRISHTLLHT